MPPGKTTQHNNPYASAAGAYGNNAQKHAADPREMEARVLLKSAQFLQDLQNDWGNVTSDLLGETLKYNRSIWLMFYDTALENPEGNRPNDLRSNIVNLANFIFKREIDIIAKPEKNKLDVLIKINRDIAGGLMQGVANAAGQEKAENNAKLEALEKYTPSSGGGTDISS
jgi:flagellar biosynthesis activator protein FlaF